MKSHFLVGVASEALAKQELRSLLPGHEEPWLLQSQSGDPIAYFSVGSDLDGEKIVHVQADVSGRHYGGSAEVLKTLSRLQALVGGVLVDDA
jgi:hypothetical protein